MEKESQSARQQDTNKLKEGIWEFFAQDNEDLPVLPRHKTGHCFNHIGTARALCPRAYIWEFDNTEGFDLFYFLKPSNFSYSFLEKITSGEIEITANNFLYNERVATIPAKDEDWDVKNGLLCSELCLWVCSFFFWSRSELIYNIQAYKSIFMGNGFWLPSDKKKKSAVGKINGLTRVTPSILAYAVAQVLFYSTFLQLPNFF